MLLFLAESGLFPLRDPVLVFAAVMLIVLIAPLLARSARLPGIVGLIVFGAAVGPHAAGILERGDTIILLGTVGLLYLMFTAGMSMDLHQFAQTRTRSLTFGTLSFAFPMGLGIAAGMRLLGYDIGPALLLGAIVGSHTLLAYPTAKRIGITRNPAVTMTMGGTIFTDAFSLTVLAVVAAMAVGEMTTLFWFEFTGKVGAFALLIIFGLPYLGRWFFRNIKGGDEVNFGFLMVVLFLAAAGSQFVGLAPIVGAFLAGLTLNRLVPDTGPLMSRLHFVGDAVFIPFFLISVGMLVDFRVLAGEWIVWMYAITFTGLVLVGKLIAAQIARGVYGFSSAEGWTIYGLTIPQAAATLAVTLVGYELTQRTDHVVFTETEVNAVIIMMLLTCLVGPWLVDHFGRKVALAEEVATPIAAGAPLRILIPLANPASAPALMDLAFMIRRTDSPEPVYPLTVANESGDVEKQVAAGERMLGYAVTHATAANVPVIPVTRIDMNIAEGILRAIRELRISTVLIGWAGDPSRHRRILGSVLDHILESSPQSVFVCRFVAPLNTTKRVRLILPRFVEREPGFGEAMRMIRLMTNKLNAKLICYTPEADPSLVESRVTKIKPSVPTEFETISPWFDLVNLLGEDVERDDLIVLISAREGRLSWSPELNRLPRRLVERFRDQNLIMHYPTELAPEAGWSVGKTMKSVAAPLLRPERVLLDSSADSLEELLNELLSREFGEDSPMTRALCQYLLQNAQEYSTEVAPGVALVHAHVADITEPTLFIATSESGLDLPQNRTPAHVLLVMLSPKHDSPERHLQSLASLARMMQGQDIVERLRSVTTYQGLVSILSDKGTSPQEEKKTGND
jgi:Kef-type K+ transport system membrane component KefB/mannitol/fructose-specific phosphotransferase system IIA component (Ntr-type)